MKNQLINKALKGTAEMQAAASCDRGDLWALLFWKESIMDEKEFWNQANESENIALLSRIARLRKKGVDIERMLAMVDTDNTVQTPSKPADRDFREDT